MPLARKGLVRFLCRRRHRETFETYLGQLGRNLFGSVSGYGQNNSRCYKLYSWTLTLKVAFQHASISCESMISAGIGSPGATEQPGMEYLNPAPLGFGQMLRPDMMSQ